MRTRGMQQQEQQDQMEQVAGLPMWMHGAPDDVGWRVLEMMGMSQ